MPNIRGKAVEQGVRRRVRGETFENVESIRVKRIRERTADPKPGAPTMAWIWVRPVPIGTMSLRIRLSSRSWTFGQIHEGRFETYRGRVDVATRSAEAVEVSVPVPLAGLGTAGGRRLDHLLRRDAVMCASCQRTLPGRCAG